MNFDVAIIGAGPSGLFASFQAGLLGMSSCIIDTLEQVGGQCSMLYPEKPIYDVPAYTKISGQDLINQLEKQADNFNVQKFLNQQVIALEAKTKDSKFFTLKTSANNIIYAKIIIIAAGAGSFGPNRPPLEGIEQFENKTVLYFIKNKEQFEGKKILIAGGGDSALDWAVELSKLAKVTVVHRRNKFRAARATVQKVEELAANGQLELILNYQLHQVHGTGSNLETVTLKDLDENIKQINVDFLLPFFGLAQNLGPILEFGLGIKNNHIIAPQPHYKTDIDGIYAIGDISTYPGKLKLILTSFAEAASALHHAYEIVFDGKALHFEYSTTKATKLNLE